MRGLCGCGVLKRKKNLRRAIPFFLSLSLSFFFVGLGAEREEVHFIGSLGIVSRSMKFVLS